MILPPNILITNYCNQNCSFCFARKEMQEPDLKRDMPIGDFKKLLKKIKKTGATTIKLLGGEPTLHPEFSTILKLSAEAFPSVQIFTNGIFSKKIAFTISGYFPRVKLTFNSMTPGFLLQPAVRQTVIERIEEYATKTHVTLSLTIDPLTNITSFFKLIPQKALQNIHNYRIGFSNPTVGDRNYYLFSDFPKMGNKLYTLIQTIKEKSPHATMKLNCGFTRCMFTDKEYKYVSKHVNILGWGCFGKESSMDITTEMSAFHCFPLSPTNRFSIKDSSLKKIETRLLVQRYAYWKNIYLKVCQKCPFYGHVPDKCPGPCIAFRMNG